MDDGKEQGQLRCVWVPRPTEEFLPHEKTVKCRHDPGRQHPMPEQQAGVVKMAVTHDCAGRLYPESGPMFVPRREPSNSRDMCDDHQIDEVCRPTRHNPLHATCLQGGKHLMR